MASQVRCQVEVKNLQFLHLRAQVSLLQPVKVRVPQQAQARVLQRVQANPHQ